MVKSLSLVTAASLLIASAASAQVQIGPTGSGNAVTAGYSQTLPQASATTAPAAPAAPTAAPQIGPTGSGNAVTAGYNSR
jgi:hypothetical protein